jgi:hypothetical protein
MHKKANTCWCVATTFELEWWMVASCDWIKKGYIMKEIPCPLILDAANNGYPSESRDVF